MQNRDQLKHDIYNKLAVFSEQDLVSIINFVEFMAQKKEPRNSRLINLQGVIKNYEITNDDINQMRKKVRDHLDRKIINE